MLACNVRPLSRSVTLFHGVGARGFGLMYTLECRTPRPLPAVAGAKTKNFPHLSYFPRRGEGGSRQKMERKFLVLLRRFSLRKEQSYYNIFVCFFLKPHGDRGASVSVFCGSSNLREPHTTTSAQPARFARAGCFGVACVRLMTSRECSGNSKNMDCARHNKFVCA